MQLPLQWQAKQHEVRQSNSSEQSTHLTSAMRCFTSASNSVQSTFASSAKLVATSPKCAPTIQQVSYKHKSGKCAARINESAVGAQRQHAECTAIGPTINHSANHSLGQPISQSFNQPPILHPASHSTIQPANQQLSLSPHTPSHTQHPGHD